MSPPRRGRSTYRPPRRRSELLGAIASALAVLVVSGVLVWALRPRPHHASTPTGTVPASLPTPGSSTPAASSTPAPASSAPTP